MKRPMFVADVVVVKSRFRRGLKECVVKVGARLEVTINGAVSKFDFEGAQFLAVTNGSDRARLNWNAFDVRDDADWLGLKRNYGEKQNHERNGGIPPHQAPF